MRTSIKNIKIDGSLMTFDCPAGSGFKAIIDRRSRIPEAFAFSEDAFLNAQAAGASLMGIVTPSEICICLMASAEIVVDECGAKSMVFHQKNAI